MTFLVLSQFEAALAGPLQRGYIAGQVTQPVNILLERIASVDHGELDRRCYADFAFKIQSYSGCSHCSWYENVSRSLEKNERNLYDY